jgi:hypothetical protein
MEYGVKVHSYIVFFERACQGYTKTNQPTSSLGRSRVVVPMQHINMYCLKEEKTRTLEVTMYLGTQVPTCTVLRST